MQVMPAARPSRPSMRLMMLMKATTQRSETMTESSGESDTTAVPGNVDVLYLHTHDHQHAGAEHLAEELREAATGPCMSSMAPKMTMTVAPMTTPSRSLETFLSPISR